MVDGRGVVSAAAAALEAGRGDSPEEAAVAAAMLSGGSVDHLLDVGMSGLSLVGSLSSSAASVGGRTRKGTNLPCRRLRSSCIPSRGVLVRLPCLPPQLPNDCPFRCKEPQWDSHHCLLRLKNYISPETPARTAALTTTTTTLSQCPPNLR